MQILRSAVAIPLSFAAAAFALVAACGGTALDAVSGGGADGAAPTSVDGGDGTPVQTDLPCAVQTVLEKNCQSCHAASPKFGAPMPLVTRANLLAPAKSNASKRKAAST